MPPAQTFAPPVLAVIRKDGKIYSHLRKKWLVETPEERVRQEFLCVLVNDYKYLPNQIREEESVTGRGSAQARADFLIYKTAEDNANNAAPFIVVECKSDNVTITDKDYLQGELYARMTGAPFYVTHNSRETKYWRIVKDKMPGYREEIANIPNADDDDKRIKDLIDQQKTFNEKDFARLLQECHDIIRNSEKKDPAAAFDEISKVLFMKVDQERRFREKRTRKNLFTAEFLKEQQGYTGRALQNLFETVKEDYKADKIFAADEQVNLNFDTALQIVRKLEKYNLSDTSEDIKGIAFERFLGRTFRGEIGQFFTPRTIVEFMIEMIDPQEEEIICDPASGSGGFLIRAFEIVREKILRDADRQQSEQEAEIDALSVSNSEKAARKLAVYEQIQTTLDQHHTGSRLWNLANRCLYGTDANDRMARTSKMNMIMHGDGHGGVHHHDGLLNVNGIFENRFQIILTNPPFGASVDSSDKVREDDVKIDDETRRRYERDYKEAYKEARNRLEAAKGQSILSLFDLPKGKNSKVKTEILFIERCLSLLAPGGRMGIVLPEGIFNNPSLEYVREFCEDRAYILAVVSLPQETFASSGASVKASLLFLRKFTALESKSYEAARLLAMQETQDKLRPSFVDEITQLNNALAAAKMEGDKNAIKAAQDAKLAAEKRIKEQLERESRAVLKAKWDYPIFLYDADKVGITATGEADANELYPNAHKPADCDKTCVELYREFVQNPAAFLLSDVSDTVPEAE